MEKEIELRGNKWLYKFWSWMFRRTQAKANKHQKKMEHHMDKTFEVTNVHFYNPYMLIIQYIFIEMDTKHEIVIQKDFKDAYKEYNKTKELPKEIDLKMFVRARHETAIKKG